FIPRYSFRDPLLEEHHEEIYFPVMLDFNVHFLYFQIFGFVKAEYERNSTSGIMSSIFGERMLRKNLKIQENTNLYDSKERLPYSDNEKIEDCDCGPVYNNQERIHKGKDANPPHKYPWAIYITFMKNGKKFICTGSIIHENYVLTAAHCFMLGTTIREGIIDTDTVKVHVGDFSRSSSDDIENVTQIMQIHKIIIHVEVNLKFLENDIALLRLTKPLDLKSHKEVKSICLPKSPITVVENMTIIGWGKTGPKESNAKNLQEAQVSVYKHCLNPRRFHFDSNLLCIGRQESFLCRGDSGGPIMKITNGRYEVAGVVSFTTDNDGNCAAPTALTYLVNVAEYYNWIQRYVQFNCI
ncbi:Chymotrypsin-C, partial [Armadillidium nasatum]